MDSPNTDMCIDDCQFLQINEVFKRVRELVAIEEALPMHDGHGKYLLDAENALLEYLKQNPNDMEGWLLLLCIETNPPLEDPYRIIEFAQRFLENYPLNPYALLFWSYADYYLMANDNEELYRQLYEAKSDDTEIMSMIEVAKARYCEKRDIKKYEECLLASIYYCDYHVTNYGMLGQFYIEHNRIKEGIALIRQGFKNIKRLVTPENAGIDSDPVSLQDFLNEFFTGTTIVYVEYGRLCNLIQEAEGKKID